MSLAEDTNVHDLIDRDDPVAMQWARFRDAFASDMGGSLYALEDLERRVLTHKAILFAGDSSAVIGQASMAPDGRLSMSLLWACGRVPGIVALLPGIEALARVQGCHSVTVEGPRGWERILKASGYGFHSIRLEKGL